MDGWSFIMFNRAIYVESVDLNKYLCSVSLIFTTIGSQHKAAQLRDNFCLFVLFLNTVANVTKIQGIICVFKCMYMYKLI